MRRDTSNPKKIAKHSQIGGETSNPKTLIPMTQLKLTTSQGGRHFKPLHLEIDNPVEALNRSTQQTLVGEDEVLKQLQKTQANISLWCLLMASYKHRKNLVDLLNQIQVPTTKTSQDLNAISINRELTISYSDKDLTKKGKHHNDLLHITIDAMGKRISMVLVNDGSALNVCPLKTTSYLGLSVEDFVPTDQHVRAYDNSRREVLGTITLELTIGLMVKKVDFQALNIASCFNMLLGRPWTHDTEVVPSSLYQKVRFPHGGAIVTIYEDTLIVPKPVYGIDSEKEPLSLDGFEIERPSFEKKEEEVEKIPMDFTPYGKNNVVAMMRRMNYLLGMNLGKAVEKPIV